MEQIIATAKNCRVSNCVDTTVYLCTNHKPIVIGDTRAVVFGPYNASYDQFERYFSFVEYGLVISKQMF